MTVIVFLCKGLVLNPSYEHTWNPFCDSKWRRVEETHHYAHRKPNLWLWMEKSRGNPSLSTQETQRVTLNGENTWNPSLSTQETQPVTLNGEEYRKPITIKHSVNPTCDSGYRLFQETQPVIRGNCSSRISTLALFLLVVSLLIEMFNYFVLILVWDLMNAGILISTFGWFLSSLTVLIEYLSKLRLLLEYLDGAVIYQKHGISWIVSS